MHYYTYAYLREDKTPYYIGKGQGNRIYSKQKYIKPPKDKSRIIYLKQNLTEEEAFKHEIYMIDVFGRKDLGTGILHNRTDGGEGSSGAIRSDEYRKKMSEAKKGKTRSEESKIKMSEAHKGRTHSEETKRKLSDANRGENNPSYGKTHSEETKKRMSDAHKNPPEEIRKKQSVAMSGRKWWNDGCGNVKLMIECPGDGWKLGMKPNGVKNENAEVGFEEWFNGNYGKFSCRSEWFYGDCEVKDEKIRKDLVYNWVRSAYLSGYELGGALEELAQGHSKAPCDAL